MRARYGVSIVQKTTQERKEEEIGNKKKIKY